MKTKILSILALLLTVTQGAWALSGSGTQADPYLITSASDWHELAIQQTAYATGKYYRLTADIIVTEGTNANLAFAGIFDGNGHTITLNITSSQQRAGLFPYIAYLTVKNLHVTGQITTSNTQAGGIAGCANHGTNKFENCRVSITISGSSNGYAHHAGFVGYVQNSYTKVELSNCVFDGTLTGDNVTRKWRGFIGYQESGTTATFTNCYFRPRSLSINSSTDGSDFFPFAYNGANSNTYANCLYTYQYSGTDLGSDGTSGISTASTTVSTVVSTLGSDNWKSVTESSVEYVVPIWQYTVFFDANGGSGAPAAQTKKDGTALALSSTVPTRDGYTFTGWNTAADGSGTNYAAGATYTGNADLSLYAQWTPTYTATFADGNDNTGWTIAPTSDVEGATVTVSYSGENKVKSVTVQAKQ